MAQVTKETLTKKEIMESLAIEQRRGRISILFVGVVCALALSVGMILFFVPFSIQDTFFKILIKGFGVFFVVCSILPIRVFIIVSKPSKGEKNFYVITDKLIDITTETVKLKRNRLVELKKNIFYFQKKGKYVTGLRDQGAVQYSDVGDTFYLVMINNAVKLVYNAKIYQYEGEIYEQSTEI
jgi:hypothetical protein